MELTLESAFSADGLIGHLSYFLLVLSMLMQRMTWLRIFALSSAAVGICYSFFILHDPVGTFWESALFLVNVGQLLLLHWKNLRASFSDEELEFVNGKLPGLARGRSRALLNKGRWIHAEDGTILTREGSPSGALTYISRGTVDIIANGVKVSQCGAGDFIGEMTVLNDEPATATTRVSGTAQLWQITSADLKSVLSRHPEIGTEIEASFARNYREKLVQSNFLVSKGIVP